MKSAAPCPDLTVAAQIAGEDITRGDFVAVLNEIAELPSFLWSCSGASLSPHEPVRIRFVAEDAGQPYRVIGVCLPFVYAQDDQARMIVLDTRQQQLARLDPDCARAVWKTFRNQTKKKRK